MMLQLKCRELLTKIINVFWQWCREIINAAVLILRLMFQQISQFLKRIVANQLALCLLVLNGAIAAIKELLVW